MSNTDRIKRLEAAAMGRPRLISRDERIKRLEAALREIAAMAGPFPPEEDASSDEADWQRVRDLVVPHGIRLDLMVGNVTRFNLRFIGKTAAAALEDTP